ncbi:MAG: ribosome biogenesis GTP-binding protein YihA/YsxC [Polyangiaceae bacterium]
MKAATKAPAQKKPAAKAAAAKEPAAKAPAPKAAASPKDHAGEPFEIIHADFTAAAGPGSTLPDHGFEVAFAGRSNVGKSSLINGLTGRKNLVRVGATPGVTRTLTQFSARTRAGGTFALVDLPGYGFAQRSKAERQQWADLIEGYLRDRDQLVAVVLLVDARRGVEEEDRALIEFVMTPGETPRPVPELFLIATKIDKISKSAQLAAVNAVKAPGGVRAIAWSSVTGQGRSDLARRIALALERAGARR